MREITTNKQLEHGGILAMTLAALVLLISITAFAANDPQLLSEPIVVDFAGGSEAIIYDSDYVLDNLTLVSGDGLLLNIPGYAPVELILPGDISAWNVEVFHTHQVENVIDALAAISFPLPVRSVEIFLLPYPRSSQVKSSAVEGRIFMSPGSRVLPPEATHMIVTHELGHVFHYQNMPDYRPELWDAFAMIRGIDSPDYHAAATHANRPHEVFAEDFRYLFGGALANYSGTIENSGLQLPDSVNGLREFMLGLSYGKIMMPVGNDLQVANYPNPFNPMTSITVMATASEVGKSLSVSIYDVQGRLVKLLHQGSMTGIEMRFQWQGQDEAGNTLPSGVYFSHVRLGGQEFSHKMIFVG